MFDFILLASPRIIANRTLAIKCVCDDSSRLIFKKNMFSSCFILLLLLMLLFIYVIHSFFSFMLLMI